MNKGDQKSPIVLIIEDDQILLRMLEGALTKRGFTVLEAKNGIDGIRVLDTNTPTLILLDIHMPQMDGLTMLERIRTGGKRVPVLMLTNLNDPDFIARAAELGVVEYLIKSEWEIDDIVKKVAERLLPDTHR